MHHWILARTKVWETRTAFPVYKHANELNPVIDNKDNYSEKPPNHEQTPALTTCVRLRDELR